MFLCDLILRLNALKSDSVGWVLLKQLIKYDWQWLIKYDLFFMLNWHNDKKLIFTMKR